MLYRFEPILKRVIWGGEKIAAYKGISTTHSDIGESWELSGIAGNESVVAEGAELGMTLRELLLRDGAELVGRDNFDRFGPEFPLLVKFIDAHRDLSIQVHPNDEIARRHHSKSGKSEMWYVIGADRDAHLKAGFKSAITPDEYERRVADGSITEALADYRVKEGDLFYLPAGRIHTICAGTLLVEIQQPSDVTYRIYDYDRTDSEGRKRELHTELAREAIDYTVLPDYRTRYTEVRNHAVELISTPHFTTRLYDLTEPHNIDLSTLDSFIAIVALRGSGTLRTDDGSTMRIAQGQTILAPATTQRLDIEPEGALKLLTASVERQKCGH